MTLIFAAIVFVAFAVQTTSGFGSSIVTLSLGAFFFPIDTILPPLVALNFIQCTYLVLRDPGAVDPALRRIVPIVVAGVPIGMALMRLSPDAGLKLAFGLMVSILASLELLKLVHGTSPPRRLGRLPTAMLLFGAGVTHGLYSCGGPMVVYVAARQIPDKRMFRGTLSALWVLLSGALLLSFVVAGDYSGATVKLTGYLMLPLVIGIVVGQWLHQRVNPVAFRAITQGLLLVAGISLLLVS